MHHDKGFILRSRKRQPKQDQRGVALITTLLLLMLLTGLTLTMAWSARSDMLINGYYRNFRGSFYAADSGLNIVRQAALNQFQGGVGLPATFAVGVQPIPPGTEVTIAATINTAFAGYQKINTGSVAVNSWPEQFKLPTTTSFTLSENSCSVVGTPAGGTCAVPPLAPVSYTYTYDYTITVQGQSQGGENATLFDRGQLIMTATVVNASSKTSFAAWGMFIDKQKECSNGTLVPGTITGPVFTNGGWTFGNGGPYIFTGTVGQADTQAGFSAGSCVTAAASSGNGITPTFQQPPFKLGQPTVPLPTNSFNQERAVLDGTGSNNTQPSATELNVAMKSAKTGNKYSSSGESSGVFLPYLKDASGNLNFTGGGILVEGTADAITLTPSGAAGQTYQIKQGSDTTVITIDASPITGPPAYPNGKTIVSVNGGTATTISGVPQQIDPASGKATGPGTMLYVNGSVSSLSGPGQGLAGINDHTALTITAANNVTITGDLLYKSPPVTLAASSGTPIDSLIAGNDHGQTLGIFTATGDIQMNNKQPLKTMEIDASLATISTGGTGGLINTGAALDKLTIVGGRIQSQIDNINTTTRNVMFDVRYASGTFAPPWFPSTTVSLGGVKSASWGKPIAQRLSWQNLTATY